MIEDEQTVELDTTVIDSADLSNIGLIELADPVIEVGGDPDQAGTLDRRVRISGTLTIEKIGEETGADS